MRTALAYTAVVAGLFVLMAWSGRGQVPPLAEHGAQGQTAQHGQPAPGHGGERDGAGTPDRVDGQVQPVFGPGSSAQQPPEPEPAETESSGAASSGEPLRPEDLDAAAGNTVLSLFPADPAAAAKAWLQPERGRLQGLLAGSLPALASAPQPPAADGWPPWLARLLPALTGRRDVRPHALLATVLPGLTVPATAEPEPPGTPPEPVPVDPRLFFPLFPGSADSPSVQIGEDPLIGFYNSHAYESYISEMAERPDRLADIATDDNGRNVVLVSRELARVLSETYGIATVHSGAHHHLQGTNYSYTLSRLTAERLLEEYPSVKILIDVHRDSDRRDKTVAVINGQAVARVRLVVGRGDGGNLANPQYEHTRAFAEAIFAAMERKYPGLARDIYEQDTRFNQDLLPATTLLEIGGPENTMDEALRTAALLADVLQEVIRSGGAPGVGR